MANVGPNKGRRLRAALSRFAAMLISEAQYVSGLSHAQLDEALGLSDGQSFRYSLYPLRAKTRAPQAGSIQQLENRVAALLKRPAHKVVVEDNRLLLGSISPFTNNAIGTPSDRLDLETSEATDFQLGYEGDWPTFRRLILKSLYWSVSRLNTIRPYLLGRLTGRLCTGLTCRALSFCNAKVYRAAGHKTSPRSGYGFGCGGRNST